MAILSREESNNRNVENIGVRTSGDPEMLKEFRRKRNRKKAGCGCALVAAGAALVIPTIYMIREGVGLAKDYLDVLRTTPSETKVLTDKEIKDIRGPTPEVVKKKKTPLEKAASHVKDLTEELEALKSEAGERAKIEALEKEVERVKKAVEKGDWEEALMKSKAVPSAKSDPATLDEADKVVPTTLDEIKDLLSKFGESVGESDPKPLAKPTDSEIEDKFIELGEKPLCIFKIQSKTPMSDGSPRYTYHTALSADVEVGRDGTASLKPSASAGKIQLIYALDSEGEPIRKKTDLMSPPTRVVLSERILAEFDASRVVGVEVWGNPTVLQEKY